MAMAIQTGHSQTRCN